MLRKEIINGEEYYCHYIDGNVGDIFRNAEDIQQYKHKLINQIAKTKQHIINISNKQNGKSKYNKRIKKDS